jgi:imidazolonepropionase-like amidohydrolase
MRWLASCFLLFAFGTGGVALAADTVVLRASKLYVSPDAPALMDAVIVIRDGRIVDVGSAAKVRVPKGAAASECSGGVVTAGFQNSHVHFTEERWKNAADAPADGLTQSLEAMLSRFGFTTVFDTGSDQANTVALRARIKRGEVRGPRIFTVGLPLYPPDGIPHYIADLPKDVLARMHQPRTPAEAREAVRANMAAGADGTKVFLVTSPSQGVMRHMSVEIARAAVEETHRNGKLAFAHPSTVEGIRIALAAGVDVLVHTTLAEIVPWDDKLLRQMTTQRMSVIPTFKLWTYELNKAVVPPHVIERLVGATHEELRVFSAAGGQVLFGTDVGYMHEYDPTDEYAGMVKAGLSPMQILASLTTAPAARWNESGERGRIATGYAADLTVLAADPADDVANFARVRCTLRGGTPIYRAP